MKIYEIGTGYTPIPAQMGAATEIVVEELTRSFIANGEEVEIIDISSSNRKQSDLPITEVKVPVFFTKSDVSLGIVHKLKRVVYSVALAFKLKKILKNEKEKPVLHFHNQYNLFFFSKLVSLKYRSKCIIAYTNHSFIWHGEWDEIENTVKKRYFQEISAMRCADIVFVLNSNTQKNIIEHCKISPDKVHLIKNGVNTNIYSVLSEKKKEQIKQQNGLKDKKVFIQVGSVCPRKNQLFSLELLLPFMTENNNVFFCYVGGIIDEEYQNQILRLAKENNIEDRVRYFGELAPGVQLNEFYNMADAMIFPSTAEGFSLTVIEAMSAGVPVIISNSLTFALSNRCLSFGSKDEFSDIVKSSIEENTSDAINQKVRDYVKNEYSWERIANDYLEFFQGI